MKRIRAQFAARRQDVQAHAFFGWLSDENVPLEKRFVFSPLMIDFIMGFADMNKWFLSYEAPVSDAERGINQHTAEDRTHSRLFTAEWRTLDLGGVEAWPAGKLLWWLFQSEWSRSIRELGMEILRIAVQQPAVGVRFALMESIEICGDVFFAATAPLAQRLSARDGEPHPYFGEYHRVRETGHLHTDESAFDGITLAAHELDAARDAVDRVFDLFLRVLDAVHAYGVRAVSDLPGLGAELGREYAASTGSPAEPRVRCVRGADPSVDGTQEPMVAHLAARVEALRQHAFVRWLRAETPAASADTLRSFMALWGFDLVSYRDFNELVLRYPNPRSDAERALNAWTERLAPHGRLYLRDWLELGMDDYLGWDAGTAVEFYFLSGPTEVHRRNMSKVKRHAFAHSSPLARFWLLHALEAGGEPLFEVTAPLASRIEHRHGLSLDYWAHRHDAAGDADCIRAARHTFLGMQADPGTVRDALTAIDLVFDNLEEQLSLSLSCARDGAFAAHVSRGSTSSSDVRELRVHEHDSTELRDEAI